MRRRPARWRGTGNLEAGLTNKYNVWVSTLDKADVDVMHTRIKMMNEQVAGSGGRGYPPSDSEPRSGGYRGATRPTDTVGSAPRADRDSDIGGANLLDSHVFQFDFLNDSFDKLPPGLKEIIDDPEKRKKLVIYINPPYKEAPQVGTKGQKDVQVSAVNRKYAEQLGQGNRELFAQFFTRMYFELEGCIIAEFSTLKILQGPHFVDFRKFFLAKLLSLFVVPANTFDNVEGAFPIGFMIWNTAIKEHFESVLADVYDSKGVLLGQKSFRAYDYCNYMNEWVKTFRAKPDEDVIGKFPFKGNDFQNQNMIQIVHPAMKYNVAAGQFLINASNVHVACVYFAVRKCLPANWLNDRDQFLWPNDGWKDDLEFQSDCLVYTLFNNAIQSQYGVNHWIPYTEVEVGAKDCFASHFMSEYIAGRAVSPLTAAQGELPLDDGGCGATRPTKPLTFSPTARAVLDAGRALWRYYHAQPNANPNASYYDIRAHFQGRKPNGTMNATSDDEKYNELLDALKAAHKRLAAQIAPKVYASGFLRA